MEIKREFSGSKKIEIKACPSCGIVKSRNQYGKDGSRPDGISWECKECKLENGYYQRIKREYGLNREQYLNMKRTQDSSCLCCKEVKKLVVDHDHETGKVRGLLCDNCNLALGLLKDSVGTLERMIKYVQG